MAKRSRFRCTEAALGRLRSTRPCGRIGVTRSGKLAAVVISVADLEALEAFEMEQDVAAYRDAKAADDGTCVILDYLPAELVS